MKRLIFMLLTLITTSVFAQQTQYKPLVQFTGIVLNADSDSIVPYATITNVSFNKQINLANYKGYFSFVAHEQDTIRFTCIGYASTIVVIPSNIQDKSYTLKVKLSSQTINLPTVHVFPWATTDEFRKDILTMKIADDDLEIARKNLAGRSIASLRRSLPRDSKEIQSAIYQDMHNNIVNSHSPTNPFLNPFAWGALIKEIVAGNKSRGVTTDN